jgi:hypothetical protein
MYEYAVIDWVHPKKAVKDIDESGGMKYNKPMKMGA